MLGNMFHKLVLIMLVSCGCRGHKEGHNHNWDLAVVSNDRIELLQSNGSLVGQIPEQFSSLKALTFDNIRHQLIASDVDQYNANDTIFTIPLTGKTDVVPFIQNLPDDVQGLAVDPISDTLFWTDNNNKSINSVSLSGDDRSTKIVLAFDEEMPQDIAIDICRGRIYWTNSNFGRPTIERSRLDGSERQILIDSDLKLPAGIAIDYKSQRIYWADMREGIYFRIESTNLDGKEREIVYNGSHTKPFGLAVDEHAIYYTDINNNALWRIVKSLKQSVPERIKEFSEKPMGLVAKNTQIKNQPDCEALAEAAKNYSDTTMEEFEELSDDDIQQSENVSVCLNSGELIGNACKCTRGFIGRYCEISVCHNFCMQGTCHLSSLGYPKCVCAKGFSGSRCEKHLCDGFCLNGGKCSYNADQPLVPKCHCPQGTSGPRCEINLEFRNLCDLYCKNKEDEYLASKNKELICRCDDGASIITKTNASQAQLFLSSASSPPADNLYDHLIKDPFFFISCVLAVVVLSMLFLIIYNNNCNHNNRGRPRIKKRIIVNKNITPLTYRPQPNATEQCEITIENCCNMNVCETPCFEPSQLRTKKQNDDKKNLLSNMENGEDLY